MGQYISHRMGWDWEWFLSDAPLCPVTVEEAWISGASAERRRAARIAGENDDHLRMWRTVRDPEFPDWFEHVEAAIEGDRDGAWNDRVK